MNRIISERKNGSLQYWLLLIVLLLSPLAGWAQLDLGGCYYIKSHAAQTFYLCPSEPCELVYAADQPYLTTKTTGDVTGSVWYLTSEMVENVEYYYVVHVSEAKYLTLNEVMGTGTQSGTYNLPNSRLRVHLQPTPGEDQKSLFQLRYTSGTNDYYTISPKLDEENGNSLNPAGDNRDSYCGTEHKKIYLNPNGTSTNVGGLIGLYLNNDSKSKWKLVSTGPAQPTISYSHPNITFSHASSTSFKYTTDGRDPFLYGTTINSTSIDITEISGITFPCTIKAVALSAEGICSKVATYNLEQVETPALEVISNRIYITCPTVGASIYYTTNGNDPDPNEPSQLYNNEPLTCSGTTIKAIAVKAGMVNSVIFEGSETLTCDLPIISKTPSNTFTIVSNFPSGVKINYTWGANPDDPTTSSGTLYDGPVPFDPDYLPFTVKAIAYVEDNSYDPSDVATQLITADLQLDTDGFYIISSNNDFITFVMMVNGDSPDANYKIINDINVPAGAGEITVPFTGELKGVVKADGTFPVVSNLSHAIFNTINGGKVNSVMLDDVNISSGINVGAICNEATGASRIYNCGILATGSTVATDEDGYTNITSCSSTISGSNYVGGLVGLLDGSSRVINCFSYANITGGAEVGGIVGHNNVATTSANLQTMVMNCMFYGDITGGTSKAPIYNGEIITNDGDTYGVNNFNYFRMEASYVLGQNINVYNCALAAETRFLQRFEFFRHLLNSNRALAAWWATGNRDNKDEMLKWVMIPESIGTTTPYPILRQPIDENNKAIVYPSVVNYTPSNEAIDAQNLHRNEGRKLTQMGTDGELAVTIRMGDGEEFQRATGAAITNEDTTLIITDKDPEHFNFNYGKVQLPYYNQVGTNNYRKGGSDGTSRVVTGWKIVEIIGGTAGSFITTGDDVTYDADGNITKTPYNFADRKCTNKDKYSTSSHRVFNQGAYWDVPDGVTAITIEPYWAKCVYLADGYLDVVYKNGTASGTGVGQSADAMVTAVNVTTVGGGQHYNNGSNYTINGESQTVYTTIENARTALAANANHTVYDYAIVLVDNYHYNLAGNNGNVTGNPCTVMAADLDFDNEPDANLIMRFNGRTKFHALRYDFLNIPGLGMAQKATGGTGTYNFGIMQPLGWFETTNTSLFRETQFEYDNNNRVAAPYILQGGVMEQWVLGQNQGYKNKTTYFHVGGNVWFKEFHRGTHQDEQYAAKHPPVSVTGGEYEQFHLTGLYRADVAIYDDDAECYITGGKFGIMAGTGMDGIGHPENHTNGNITWIIDHADINEFYAGSFNADRPAQGNLRTIINNSYVDYFYGGPKFGDLNEGRTVITTATDCTFGTFFGAGYGGNSYSREAPFNHNNIINFPHSTSQAGSHDSWNAWVREYYTQAYNATYGGVSTQFNYQFLPMSSNVDNVARLWIEYVKFSLATTRSVKSTLTGCTVKNNFYGGGSLGKVAGPVESVLDGCIVLGNVYGAGYLATPPPVEVDSINGFRIEPYYYENLGAYRKGVKGQTTTYSWEHADQQAVDHDLKILYTTENLGTLGTVEGNVTLTLKGATIVGTEGDSTTGNVYGGGDQSTVIQSLDGSGNPVEDTGNTTVKLQGGAKVLGNVYGGGNEGFVGGNSQVIIQDDSGTGTEP